MRKPLLAVAALSSCASLGSHSHEVRLSSVSIPRVSVCAAVEAFTDARENPSALGTVQGRWGVEVASIKTPDAVAPWVERSLRESVVLPVDCHQPLVIHGAVQWVFVTDSVNLVARVAALLEVGSGHAPQQIVGVAEQHSLFASKVEYEQALNAALENWLVEATGFLQASIRHSPSP